jgi:glutaredoxin
MIVKLYVAPNCPYCPEARQFARDNGIEFTEFDVSRDDCLLEAYKDLVMKTPSFVVNGIVYNLSEFKELVEEECL